MGRKLLCFLPRGLAGCVTWRLRNSEAGRMRTLPLSVRLPHTHTHFPPCSWQSSRVSPSMCPSLWWRFTLWSIPLCFFPPSVSLPSISSLCISLVRLDSSVAAPANFSLQLVRDWAHLFSWFAELSVACTYAVSLHVRLATTRPLIQNNTITIPKTHFCETIHFFLCLTAEIILRQNKTVRCIFSEIRTSNRASLYFLFMPILKKFCSSLEFSFHNASLHEQCVLQAALKAQEIVQ